METDIEWHKWKQLLGKAVHTARALGVSDKHIEEIAYRIGGLLADHVDPGNREQRLLKELWEQGDQSHKRALATMIMRMVDNDAGRAGPAAEKDKPETH
ncbi:MAG: DUF3243 domain-containing protein [Candidatus Desulforudis sp.]|nr:DUF3243 domain-containing protein [Desulforudis sp.]